MCSHGQLKAEVAVVANRKRAVLRCEEPVLEPLMLRLSDCMSP